MFCVISDQRNLCGFFMEYQVSKLMTEQSYWCTTSVDILGWSLISNITHLALYWTKWSPFRRWCFQVHFREWKGLYFDYNFTEVCSMMTSSNGNIFRVTSPLCGEFTGPGEFPTQRTVTGSFDVFFDLRLNKRLSKQWWGWWFETPSWSLWRQCNVLRILLTVSQHWFR